MPWQDAKHKFLPCTPTTDGAIEMNWRDIPRNKLGDIPVTREDFFEALKEAKPSVDPNDLHKYTTWTAKHGMNGA
jgi:vacuolar protein-sorting-associated protein 4